MRAEDLKGWLAKATKDGTDREKRVEDGDVREEDASPTEAEGLWEKVVELVQTAFRDEDHRLPGDLLGEVPVPKRRLD